MFLRLLSMEHIKVFRRYTLRIEIIILAALMVVTYTVNLMDNARAWSGPGTAFLSDFSKEAAIAPYIWPNALDTFMEGNLIFGPLLVIILVGAMTAQEYSWRTVNLWVGHGSPRLAFIAAKYLAFALPILCLVLTPLAAGGAVSGIATFLLEGVTGLTRLNFMHLASMSIGFTYSLLPYAAVTFFIAVLTRSNAATLGISLGYFLVLENLLAGILPTFGSTYNEIATHLPGVLASSLGSGILGSQLFGSPVTDNTTAAIGIGIYALVFFLLSALVFRRQDLGG
jgi:ABC-type transport system involved in multi-copper enzyme maturation permease subunit